MPNQWYVAKTQRRREPVLGRHMSDNGVAVYSPEIAITKNGSLKLEPLFPTYIFCLADRDSGNWPLIRWARGLRYFLGSETEPIAISRQLVSSIQERVDNWNSGGWSGVFVPGDRLNITSGPFLGLDAIFRSYVPPKRRCEVLISLLGRDHVATIPITSLQGSVKVFGAS